MQQMGYPMNLKRSSAASLSQNSGKTISNSEKVGSDAGVTEPWRRTTGEDGGDVERDDNKQYDDTLPSVNFDDQPGAGRQNPYRLFFRILSSIFPSPNDEEEIQAYIPHYRTLPILSGVAIPFCILLDIPGLLTADYRISTRDSTIMALEPNPPLLDVGIALSTLCAVLANACLVVRFLERRVKTMTILCTLFLLIHDVINTATFTMFGAKDDYTYRQAFWMSLCSTIVSMFTNVTLVIDLIRTPDFTRGGSGLTRRQRSLVIIIIGLFCYVMLGAVATSVLLNLTFIDGLYFTVVTIETIGFGDIVPKTTGSRIFIYFYATLGVINLAFVAGYVRETVLEGIDIGYRKRLLAVQKRRRAARHRRRAENRWRQAIIWHLRERHTPVWIPKKIDGHSSVWSLLTSSFWRVIQGIRSTTRGDAPRSHRQCGMQLNLWALPPCKLEAAALEAGVPLDTLLPADFYDTYNQSPCCHTAGVKHHDVSSWFVVHPVYRHDEHAIKSPACNRLRVMATTLARLGFTIYKSAGNPLPNGHGQNPSAVDLPAGSLQAIDGDYCTDVEDTEKKAYYTRLGLTWLWLLIFWMGGATIFKATEGWSYESSIYFCFVTFSSIGYGDFAPTTPAGRSIFVVWALIGVAIMTIFISVACEAYTARYKGILGRNSFKRVVQQCRERHKIELSAKVQCIGISTEAQFDLHVREETDIAKDQLQPEGTVTSTSEPDLCVQHAQRSLEMLPRQVLTEVWSIQRYIQLIGDFNGNSASAEKFVDEAVWNLLDDTIGGGKLTKYAKKDILKDRQSRQTLGLLGIERSLNMLVDISELAIAAVQERDRIAARLEQEAQQDDVDIATWQTPSV